MLSTDDNTLLTTTDAARRIGLAPATLLRWRGQGIGPSFLRIGPKRIRYRMRDLDAFLAAATVVTEAIQTSQ